jgi:hypothetical protein
MMLDAIDITSAPVHPLNATAEPKSAGIHLVEVRPGEFLPCVVVYCSELCNVGVVCAMSISDKLPKCSLRGLRKWECDSIKFVSIAND